MEIITNSIVSRKFRSIPEYETDLGIAIKIDESRNSENYKKSAGSPVVKDDIIKKYFEFYGRFIVRTGRIGSLLFYVDNYIKNNEIIITNNDDIFQFEYTNNSDIRTYISNILKRVIDNNVKPINKIEKAKEEKMPDIKNMSNEELAEYFSKKNL